jgi:Dolichyl-phosphate-mannose-protein mannosyltransferase
LLGLIAGIVLVGAGSGLASAAMRPDGRAPFLLASWLIAFSQIVLLALVLSAFGALTRAGWLAGHSLVATAAAALWLRAGRPRPAGPWRPQPGMAWARARRYPATAVVVAVAAVAVLLQLVVGLTTAPSNWDSMTYHLSRAAYWLQQGAVGRYDGGTVRQLASPPNAEIAVAWTMAMAGRDTFVSLVQWTALLAGAVGVWMIALQLQARRVGAALAAVVWLVLPTSIIQSTTTQNDVVVSACLLGGIAFGLRALRQGRMSDALLAALAFGTGLGTKGSFLFALPSLAVVLVAAVRQERPAGKVTARLLALTAACAVLLGSFSYVSNLSATGGPFGGLRQAQERREPIPQNVVRVAWSLAEAPGIQMRWLDRPLDGTFGAWASRWTGDQFDFGVDNQVGEDVVSAGLVGMLVLVPLALWTAVRRNRRPVARALGAGAMLFVLVFGVANVATPFNGRILLIGVAMAVPLVAVAAGRAEMRLVIGALAAASLLPAVLVNAAKPVVARDGRAAVWSWGRAAQMSVSRPGIEPFIVAIDRRLPPASRVGFVGGEDAWDYPVFGPSREREVIRATFDRVPRERVAYCRWLAAFARQHDLDAMVLADTPAGESPPPPVTRPLEPAGGYFIVRGSGLRACE